VFDGFTRTTIETGGARIVTVHGGRGPPLLLMHGNPFTHVSWHQVAPALAKEFTVVCTDLRGYGDSSKPEPAPDHANYSFRAMAQDNVEVMAKLGFRRFAAAGYDRGARVLHRMCLDHPDTVTRAAIIDIIPTHHLLNHVPRAWGLFSWHWFFMAQPFDLPERMMLADPEFYLRKKLGKGPEGLSFFAPEAFAEYLRCFKNPATVRDMCEDYRATFSSIWRWTRPISLWATRRMCRCCCCGARPAASAATTGRSTFGACTRATFAAPKHCLAVITCRSNARRKRRQRCAASSPLDPVRRAQPRAGIGRTFVDA
jgi:haloacetate dehalogenase